MAGRGTGVFITWNNAVRSPLRLLENPFSPNGAPASAQFTQTWDNWIFGNVYGYGASGTIATSKGVMAGTAPGSASAQVSTSAQPGGAAIASGVGKAKAATSSQLAGTAIASGIGNASVRTFARVNWSAGIFGRAGATVAVRAKAVLAGTVGGFGRATVRSGLRGFLSRIFISRKSLSGSKTGTSLQGSKAPPTLKGEVD